MEWREKARDRKDPTVLGSGEENGMNDSRSGSISNCARVYLMERELSAFMAAVADLFGPEQARISAEGTA